MRRCSWSCAAQTGSRRRAARGRWRPRSRRSASRCRRSACPSRPRRACSCRSTRAPSRSRTSRRAPRGRRSSAHRRRPIRRRTRPSTSSRSATAATTAPTSRPSPRRSASSPADVIELHAATTYEVLFLGFAPGFAYLGELAPPLVVPRLATPAAARARGQRRHRRADDRGLSPCLARRLAAARPDRCAAVRSRRDAAGPPPPRRPRPVRAGLTWHATPSSRSSTRASSCRSRTAGDRAWRRRASRAAAPRTATRSPWPTRSSATRRTRRPSRRRCSGRPMRALAPVTIGLAGTMAGTVTETGERVVPGSTVTLRAGDTLALEPATRCPRLPRGPGRHRRPGRPRLALDGARRRLRRARWTRRSVPAIDWRPAETRAIPHAHWPGVPAPVTVSATNPLRVLPGPHAADLGAGRARRTSSRRPGPSARRATAWGCGSHGDPIPGTPAAELASHGVVAGTIQLPPDRRPIVLLVDHQPTGGYPVLAVVISADLDRARPARARCAGVVRAHDTRGGTSGTPARRTTPSPRPSPSSATPPAGTTCGGAPAPDASPRPLACKPRGRSCKGPAMARSAGRGQTCAR